MAHKDNVDALAAKHGLPNPIPHERLKVKRVEFQDTFRETLAIIDGTPMNCASRLWVQDMANDLGHSFSLSLIVRDDLREFFAERWDGDWTLEHRPMMYWFNEAHYVVAHYD